MKQLGNTNFSCLIPFSLRAEDALNVKQIRICRGIGIKENYTGDEFDAFETLTARFARSSDMLIQKIFRSPGTFFQKGSWSSKTIYFKAFIKTRQFSIKSGPIL